MEATKLAVATNKLMLRIVAGLLLLFGAAQLLGILPSHSIRTLCNDLPVTATPEMMMELARQRGLVAHNFSNHVTVLNHNAPFFRYACTADFEAGKLVRKDWMAAD
ncbi:MAG: hypothetical protein QM776_04870 [Rhodocyclaceae bacterium]